MNGAAFAGGCAGGRLLGRGGYVFSPAQEIQGDVPAANIMALIEVARETREKVS